MVKRCHFNNWVWLIYGATDEPHFRIISQIPPEFVRRIFQPPNSLFRCLFWIQALLRHYARKHGQFMSDGYAFSLFITIHKELPRKLIVILLAVDAVILWNEFINEVNLFPRNALFWLQIESSHKIERWVFQRSGLWCDCLPKFLILVFAPNIAVTKSFNLIITKER